MKSPQHKRKARLVVALTVALLLTGALIYTSFATSSEARTPSELISTAQVGQTYELTGKVVAGSIHRKGDILNFKVRDRTGTTSVPVSYTGTVPDPFRVGREVVVRVRKDGDNFVGEKDSLVTKCPSKFTVKRDKP